MTPARISLLLLLAASACKMPFGGGGSAAAPPPATAPAVAPPPPAPRGEARAIRIRSGASPTPRTAAVIVLDEAPGPDRALATLESSLLGGPETVLHPVLEKDVVYAVVLFEDRDADRKIDAEEPVIPLRARASAEPKWSGDAIFLLTPEASFVGQAPWTLDEVWFEPLPAR